MSVLTPYASTRDAVAIALDAADYKLPHASLDQLPGPFFLIPGDAKLPGVPLATGTLVVTGSLAVTGPVDFQQTGKPIVNLIVVGDCTLGLAYVDAFLVVGGDLRVGTLIADSNWKGGVFVGGDLIAHTVVSKDIGVEVDGDEHVENLADCEDIDSAAHAVPALFVDDSPEPRQLFVALRDSSASLTPGAPRRRARSAKPANKPAAKPAKKPVAKPAKKPANKPAAKPAKKPAKRVNKPTKGKPAARTKQPAAPTKSRPARRATRKPKARRS